MYFQIVKSFAAVGSQIKFTFDPEDPKLIDSEGIKFQQHNAEVLVVLSDRLGEQFRIKNADLTSPFGDIDLLVAALQAAIDTAMAAASSTVPTGMGDGQVNVTTAGTAVPLGGDVPCVNIGIVAKTTNTGRIYVGGSGISSSTGVPLESDESRELAIDNLNKVFIDSDNNGEGVTFDFQS